jgi:hypothetical protein
MVVIVVIKTSIQRDFGASRWTDGHVEMPDPFSETRTVSKKHSHTVKINRLSVLGTN